MSDKYDSFLDSESDKKYDDFLGEVAVEKVAPVASKRGGLEEILRQTARAGKAATTGLMSLPALAFEPVMAAQSGFNRLINKGFGTKLDEGYRSSVQAMREAADRGFAVDAETPVERVSDDMIAAMGGAGLSTKVGGMLAGPVASRVGKILAANPAMQGTSAAAAGASAGTARENDVGMMGQILAGLGGGMVPTGIARTIQAGKSLATPAVKAVTVLGEQGKQQEAEQILRALAAENKGRIVNDILERKTYIPGSKVTSADAIAQGNIATRGDVSTAKRYGGELVKLQSELSKAEGTTSKLRTNEQQRMVAHAKVLDDISGSDAKLEAAIKYRDAQTQPLWDKVLTSKAKVDTSNVEKTIDDILRTNPKETAITTPLAQIKTALTREQKYKGITVSEREDNPQALASLSREIKRMIAAKTPGGGNEYDVSSLTKIKNVLDDSIGAAEGSYKQAMSKYKELSSPINRMEVGRVLKDKLLTQTGTESPGQYLRAADDAAKTLKSATGFSRYNKLEDVLNKKEVFMVNRVTKDLERALETKRIASEVNLPGATKRAEAGELQLPNLLSRPVAATNWVLRLIGKDINPEVNKIMADILDDPKKLAIVLKNTPKDRIQDVLKAAKDARAGKYIGMISAINKNEQRERE